MYFGFFVPKYLKNGHFWGQGPKCVNSEFVTVLTSQIALNFLIWVEIVNLQLLGNFKKKISSILAFFPKNTLKMAVLGVKKRPRWVKTCAVLCYNLKNTWNFCIS